MHIKPHLSILSTMLLLTTTILASPNPSPNPQQNNAPTPPLPESQYPTVTVAGSLFTVNGVVSATWVEFTQTFASTALGSWDLGPSPRVGVIGLGGGELKEKRVVEEMEAYKWPSKKPPAPTETRKQVAPGETGVGEKEKRKVLPFGSWSPPGASKQNAVYAAPAPTTRTTSKTRATPTGKRGDEDEKEKRVFRPFPPLGGTGAGTRKQLAPAETGVEDAEA